MHIQFKPRPRALLLIGVIDGALFPRNGEFARNTRKNLRSRSRENDALPASIRGDYVTKYGSMIDEGTEA